MPAYYNEIEPFAAAWLRELIVRNLIAPGEVDERSIKDVSPGDLAGYTQCHFFAGIGVWSFALRLAGWPDDRPVWTGSCPCQPFSAAGKGEGFDDARHLWPAWFRLLRERRPVVVFGEQVAATAGLAWLDVVSTDLEVEGYAFGAADLCAAGVGAPHIRQRLYFVADAGHHARTTTEWDREESERSGLHTKRSDADGSGAPLRAVADDDGQGRNRLASSRLHERRAGASGDESSARDADRSLGNDVDGRGDDGCLADTNSRGLGMHGSAAGARGESRIAHAELHGRAGVVAHTDVSERGRGELGLYAEDRGSDGTSPLSQRTDVLSGFWSDALWLPCADGKARPVEPGTFPLAHGAPARVGRLRGYGNAIVAPQAAAFIEAYLDVAGQ